jgi:ATP/maltotriose-dependent transcriptional regulator MalT
VRYLSLLLLLLFTQPFAMAEEKTLVDKIFAKHERGDTMTPEAVKEDIAQLSKLIPADDVIRTEKLQLLKCWNQAAETEQEVNSALTYTTHALANIPPNASPHYVTDLTLCRLNPLPCLVFVFKWRYERCDGRLRSERETRL